MFKMNVDLKRGRLLCFLSMAKKCYIFMVHMMAFATVCTWRACWRISFNFRRKDFQVNIKKWICKSPCRVTSHAAAIVNI